MGRSVSTADALLLLLLLPACPTTAVQGTTEVKAQAEYTLGTQAPCIRPREAVAVADLAWVLSQEALESAGLVTLRGSGIPMVCLIEQPEPCCVAGGCAGPYKESFAQNTVLAARKAGCATAWTAWAALKWPPVVRSEWIEEPHVVQSWAEQSSCGWEDRLRHEVFNMAVLRWTKVHDPGYASPVYTEIEPKMTKKFYAALDAAQFPGGDTCPVR